ncbi:AAA-associated domain-containing protein [Acidilobus saccharovorans]|uniref:AAA-associated domain-containing protein n=1 Tax=Acidilobus saccharovorans TaxID=242703 RepID=UPI0006623129|nr:AAA-associated domain-containing protein [Acidilobus saccharovorans]
MPPVTLDQVLGLVRYIATSGGVVDSSRLDELLNVDMDLLPHVVDAAVSLGLLREDKGNLVITSEGKRAVELQGRELRLLIKSLSDDVEPFKDIFDVIGDSDSIRRSQLESILRHSGYTDIEAALPVFVEWLAYMGITTIED